MSLTTYLIAAGILTVAAFVQAVTGFGFALVAVPLLALSADPTTAVVTATTASLAMTAVTAFAERRHVSWGSTGNLALASVAGMPIGLVALLLLSDRALTAVIAAVTMGCTLLIWRSWRMKPTPGRVRIAGVISGALLTATGTNGPPLVAALQAFGLEPRRFRATLAAVFTVSGVVGVLVFAVTGVFTSHSMIFVAIGLASAVVGGWAGSRIFKSLDPDRFRRIVLGALAICSLVALARVLTAS